ncbi:MAG: hypothetical protein H7Y22_05080 [Gemmatimonadaceae bacterium]|nr:hypothetical protein [Gloeobacterales cyanobacterium ES-bin-141]
MDELSPLMRSLTDQPLPFLGGFVAGILRLNLTEDPVKNWLVEQMRQDGSNFTASSASVQNNGSGKGPQPIAID